MPAVTIAALLLATLPVRPPALAPDLVIDEDSEAITARVLFARGTTTTEAQVVLDRYVQDSLRWGALPIWLVRISPSRLAALARAPRVLWIDQPEVAIPTDDRARAAIGSDPVTNHRLEGGVPTYDLAGSGIRVAVWDPQGYADHDDFTGRVARVPPAPRSYGHANNVAGILGGSGLASDRGNHPWQPYQLRGVAPLVQLSFYLSSDDREGGAPYPFVDQYRHATEDFDADLASCSFQMGIGGRYGTDEANLDYVIWGADGVYERLPFFWATANEGDTDGYFSLAHLAAAKNVISVGAINANDLALARFSSMGPTADGRLKPELVAPGCVAHQGVPVEVDFIELVGPRGTTRWDFDRGLDGWSAVHHVDDLRAEGGALKLTVAGHDPHIHGPPGMRLDTSSIEEVRVRMKNPVHRFAELLWKTATADWHDDRRVSIPMRGDGTMRTYTARLAGHPEWRGEVIQVRLDPITPGLVIADDTNAYEASCGTSLAAPTAAGVAALTLQAHRAAHPGAPDPEPASLKAILIASAVDLKGAGAQPNPDLAGQITPYGRGPDFATGFGRVDAPAAVALVRDSTASAPTWVTDVVMHTGDEQAWSVEVEPGAGLLAVTLAWDDPPAMPASSKVLINDLDLVLVDPTGGLHRPWVLDASDPSAPATTGIDDANNVERVDVDAPAAGRWQAFVSASSIGEGPQRFAMALTATAGVRSFVPELAPPIDAGTPDAALFDGGRAIDGGATGGGDTGARDTGPGELEDGCGCQGAGESGPHTSWLALLGMLALARRRRLSRG